MTESAQLLAQACQVHVQRPGSDLAPVAPDGQQQIRPREDLALMSRQKAQQQILLGGQRDELRIQRHRVIREINRQTGILVGFPTRVCSPKWFHVGPALDTDVNGKTNRRSLGICKEGVKVSAAFGKSGVRRRKSEDRSQESEDRMAKRTQQYRTWAAVGAGHARPGLQRTTPLPENSRSFETIDSATLHPAKREHWRHSDSRLPTPDS